MRTLPLPTFFLLQIIANLFRQATYSPTYYQHIAAHHPASFRPAPPFPIPPRPTPTTPSRLWPL
ncbi:hypothetical protein E2C01_039672 [Portunus trituberculatus]|uniref:Uncharacterized protein n=1 Tax=Portunus trituberculatus TaxID=210409 RepID=A0A5B7FKF9_PORTR|nr:hypothetical protein [Portunus trituberculatus]